MAKWIRSHSQAGSFSFGRVALMLVPAQFFHSAECLGCAEISPAEWQISSASAQFDITS